MRTSVQLFAFNAAIAKELKAKIERIALPPGHPGYLAPLSNPSTYQSAIFDFVADGRGSALVEAVAGSGKSTTTVEALRYVRGLDVARDVRASTFHSVGYSAILKHLGKKHDQVKPDGGKVRRLMRDNLGDVEYELYGDFVSQLIGLAKGQGVGALTPDVDAAWYELITHHDLFLDAEEATETRAVELARQFLARSNDVAKSGIVDFDDMLYLPLLWRLRLWQNDWVLIDEAQDTNPVRRAIAKLALRPGGRLVAVGDRRQSIYGFTGASHDAMDLIKREFDCTEFPLTISYRCPVAVGSLARSIVDHFEVSETAIPGTVADVTWDEAVSRLGPHDAVLCRNTAPLVASAYALIARGVGCVVLGKEIGAGLVNLVKKQRAKGIDALLERLEAYREREVAKFTARGEEGKAEAVSDRVACVTTVVDHLDEKARTIPALIAKIESMFSDTNGVLTLSTQHKAKGREWRRVAILRPDLNPSKWARQDWQVKQEQNLQYVAWTRTLEELLFVQGEAR